MKNKPILTFPLVLGIGSVASANAYIRRVLANDCLPHLLTAAARCFRRAPSVLSLVIVAALCTACGGQASNPSSNPSSNPNSGDFAELDLRPGTGTTDLTDPETGLVTRRFALSLNEAANVSPREPTDTVDDPFAAGPEPASLETVQKALENAGIDFPDGTGLAYDPGSQVLSATHSVEVLDQIEGLLRAAAADATGSMTFRFEFYEVPARLALRLEQSASGHGDHTPEWEAMEEFLSKGDARTTGVVTLHALNHQRALFEDGEFIFVTTGYERDPADPSAVPLPLLEERFSGTRIELDARPEREKDDYTIHMSLALEFATPATEGSAGQTAGSSRTLATAITLRNGQARLLGSWSAAGVGRADASGTRQLVFLIAHVPGPVLTVP